MSLIAEPEDIDGDIGDLTIRDVPRGADMSIMPHGDPRTQRGSRVYVVWNGYTTGLFYCWDDAGLSVTGFSGARFQRFPTLQDARIAFWVGADAVGHRRRSVSRSQPSQDIPPRTPVPTGQPQRTHNSAIVSSTTPSSPPRRSTSAASDRQPSRRSERQRVSAADLPPVRIYPRIPSCYDDLDWTQLSMVSETGTRPSSPSPSPSVVSSFSSPVADPWQVPPSLRDAYNAARNTRLTWIVVRGRCPGVYREAFDAFSALGPSLRAKIVSASSYDEGCRIFTRLYMGKRVEEVPDAEEE
ncbi:hypothetical protein EIP86_010683 [Pleurotus ostreatoroseus]|nr:hypothetical protein EIP86_010683 [Pleurotus ostreatoroseus]